MTESERTKIMQLSLLTTEERNESAKANVLLYTWNIEKNRLKQADIGKKCLFILLTFC